MNKKIIGLLGETGSGKDTFGNHIKSKVDSVEVFRFSQPLTDVLGIFFEKIKKEDQQWLANNLRDRFGEDILSKAIVKKIKESQKELVVLNGVRVSEDFNLIKSLGGIIVYITAPIEERWKRVRLRGEKGDDGASFEEFLKIGMGRPEQQIKELGGKADFKIENNGNIEDFEEKIDHLINNLNG